MKSNRLKQILFLPKLGQTPPTTTRGHDILTSYTDNQQLVYQNYQGQLSFIIPNIGEIARELTDKSQMQLMLTLLQSLPKQDLLRLTMRNTLNIANLAKKDFAQGLALLTEIYVLKGLPYKPQAFYIHSQIIDTAIAFDNPKVFWALKKLEASYGVPFVYMTTNLGPLIDYLTRHVIVLESLTIAAPVNRQGYLMNPNSLEATTFLLENTPCNIYARTQAAYQSEDSRLYQKLENIKGIIVE